MSWFKTLRPAPRTHSRLRFALEQLDAREVPALLTVVNTNVLGAGSLHQAILDANATTSADVIQFNIPGTGTQTISGALPAITAPVTIDGTSQPGHAGLPLVELKGNGLTLMSSNNVIRGLVIDSSSGYGIDIEGAGKNTIQSNFIGTDATGTVGKGNSRGGIYIAKGANDNIIGTNGDGVNDAAEGNLISGNGFLNRRVPTGGIWIDGAHRNVVAGNTIGADVTGSTAIWNQSFGVSITNGALANRIGTNGNGVSDQLEGNQIVGYMSAVYLADFGTNNNVVAGNLINMNKSGTTGLSGGGTGVQLAIGADHNRIGTDANGRSDSLERNVISGSINIGIDLQSDSNTVAGNYIGTDISGMHAVGNYVGVQDTGWSNVIGGTKAAARNVISGNSDAGVVLQSANPKVLGNYIGLAADGNAALGNSYGIVAYSGTDILIGGTSAAARNVISGNVNDGIQISSLYGPATIQGNYIGTDATGSFAVANGTPGDYPVGYGINLFGSDGVTIGGSTAGARNVISGNVLAGVNVEAAAGTVISGNYIGTNAAGTASVGSQVAGIQLMGASNTVIGGATTGLRNVISGNHVGIEMNYGTTGSQVLNNYLGTDKTGKLNVGNAAEGVRIEFDSSNNRIGQAGAGNVIAFNGGPGVAVLDPGSLGNAIRYNSMFSNGGPSIDLQNDGNMMLSFPMLSQVVFGASTRFVGSYTGPANSTISLDFYASPSVSTGTESRRYLGSISVTTDAFGFAKFDATLLVRTARGELIAATATDPLGNTSELSWAVAAGV